jgi:hypothetical protein
VVRGFSLAGTVEDQQVARTTVFVVRGSSLAGTVEDHQAAVVTEEPQTASSAVCATSLFPGSTFSWAQPRK